MGNFTLRPHDELVSMQGKPHRIPWAVHCVAYAAYAARFGAFQSASRLVERGGFGIGELDMFHPGWRQHAAFYATSGDYRICTSCGEDISNHPKDQQFNINGNPTCEKCIKTLQDQLWNTRLRGER